MYLKSAGSYEVAEDTERDYLTCDENGFAQTKDMPYGIYTVHQVSGWEGSELMPDFDVFISQNGATYRYLINNAPFNSFIKIVKQDAETGKTIPYAGAGFKIYDPDGNPVTMTFTYPTPTTIDVFYTNAEGSLVTPEKLSFGKGYKTYQNVLQLWEGSYLSRTAQSFYDWGVIAQHFEAMRLLGELYDTAKPLPSIDGQLSLMTAGAEERKPSAFTFSQEIIDAVLTRGSGISEGKMRIYEQFQKSLSAKENADFLKNEYGWGGVYPAIVGAGVDEQHDGKGIRISKGIGSDKPHIDLKWSQVEKRIAELIKLDRYLNPKQKFASQIMTSKSPVRSCEDIDETALSYAEIKMLATGNPHIKEKMDLDIQVQKLRLLKSSFLSEKYALEDKIIKFYPQEIARRTDVIAGLKSDIERVAEHLKPSDETFVGMTVKGAFYSEKADAGNAILEACKAMTNPDPISLGEYRGFTMELYFEAREYKVRLKGELGYPVTLGTDTFGNITRLDNALEGLPKRLEMNEMELDNLKKQFETAKVDVERPFPQEEELKAKTDRLNELNALLNVDKRENEIVGGEPDEGEELPEKKPRDLER